MSKCHSPDVPGQYLVTVWAASMLWLLPTLLSVLYVIISDAASRLCLLVMYFLTIRLKPVCQLHHCLVTARVDVQRHGMLVQFCA